MKRCRAQLTVSGSWGQFHLWPGLEVDLDRQLRPAQLATPEKGQPGTDGYVPPRPAVAAFTLRDAIAGREDCFEELEPPAVDADAGDEAQES